MASKSAEGHCTASAEGNKQILGMHTELVVVNEVSKDDLGAVDKQRLGGASGKTTKQTDQDHNGQY